MPAPKPTNDGSSRPPAPRAVPGTRLQVDFNTGRIVGPLAPNSQRDDRDDDTLEEHPQAA